MSHSDTPTAPLPVTPQDLAQATAWATARGPRWSSEGIHAEKHDVGPFVAVSVCREVRPGDFVTDELSWLISPTSAGYLVMDRRCDVLDTFGTVPAAMAGIEKAMRDAGRG